MSEPSDVQTADSRVPMQHLQPGQSSPVEEIEGLDSKSGSLGDYPIDDLLIRHENRTIHDVIRRIDQKNYVMDPDFQREFIWGKGKQSKLIESVIMRIPLPVFYMAEDNEGKMIVVDGLQRLSTFHRFVKGDLRLNLPERSELNGKAFSDLPPKMQNRIEDFNLVLYTLDFKVEERARLDIFERVNSGEPLSRQQMRNCLFMGKATRFMQEEARTEIFCKATGNGLNRKTMRDREFVNRFCAFQILGPGEHKGDMDDFLARCLRKMNDFQESELAQLSGEFHRGLANNLMLFEQNAFRKLKQGGQRSVLNASLWDVMSTGLSLYAEDDVKKCAERLRKAIEELLANEEFHDAITASTSGVKEVRCRFEMTAKKFEEILGARKN